MATRDGEIIDDLDPRMWIYITPSPGLMTEREAWAWANALANLGKAPEPQRMSTSSTWRTDVPLAADSPILARLAARRLRFFVMHWDMEWETSGPVDDDGVVYTHTEIADMVADGLIEWRPLDLGGDA